MKGPFSARKIAWVVSGLVLVAAATPLVASAAERIVLCEEFTATW